MGAASAGHDTLGTHVAFARSVICCVAGSGGCGEPGVLGDGGGVSALPPDAVRCGWASGAPDFPRYHDEEWGWPVQSDQRLFEKLSLEAFQAGLSWRTILTKRPALRAAFADFAIERVAAFDEDDVARLLGDAGIVRHRGKITAVINNAQRAQELISAEGSLAAFVWRYEPDPASLGAPESLTMCAESAALARALKQRGWRFVGPTTVYAFMQACGMVNDHAVDCVQRAPIEQARSGFQRPL
jgi:DNA-3-methyladenine glycosylase I